MGNIQCLCGLQQGHTMGNTELLNQLAKLRAGDVWPIPENIRLADVLDECGYLNGMYRSGVDVRLTARNGVVTCTAGRKRAA